MPLNRGEFKRIREKRKLGTGTEMPNTGITSKR